MEEQPTVHEVPVGETKAVKTGGAIGMGVGMIVAAVVLPAFAMDGTIPELATWLAVGLDPTDFGPLGFRMALGLGAIYACAGAVLGWVVTRLRG